MVALDISNWEVSCLEAPDVVFSIWAEPWFLFWMLYICLCQVNSPTRDFQQANSRSLEPLVCLRKQPTFRDAITGFLAK